MKAIFKCSKNICSALLAFMFLISCASNGDLAPAPNASFGNLEKAPQRDNVVYAAQPDENTVKMFKDQGFDVVINLRSMDEELGFDEEKMVLEQGIYYTRIPYLNNDDNTVINNDALTKVKEAVEEATENGHKVLVHCSHGLRAASTVGLILYRDYGHSIQEAEKISKSVGMRGNWIQTRFDKFVALHPQN